MAAPAAAASAAAASAAAASAAAALTAAAKLISVGSAAALRVIGGIQLLLRPIVTLDSLVVRCGGIRAWELSRECQNGSENSVAGK